MLGHVQPHRGGGDFLQSTADFRTITYRCFEFLIQIGRYAMERRMLKRHNLRLRCQMRSIDQGTQPSFGISYCSMCANQITLAGLQSSGGLNQLRTLGVDRLSLCQLVHIGLSLQVQADFLSQLGAFQIQRPVTTGNFQQMLLQLSAILVTRSSDIDPSQQC